MVDKKTELQKLEVAIEKNLHQFISQCYEHAVDFTVMSVKREKKIIDPRGMAHILDLARSGVQDAFLKNIDRFLTSVRKDLIEVVGEFEDDEAATKKVKK